MEIGGLMHPRFYRQILVSFSVGHVHGEVQESN